MPLEVQWLTASGFFESAEGRPNALCRGVWRKPGAPLDRRVCMAQSDDEAMLEDAAAKYCYDNACARSS